MVLRVEVKVDGRIIRVEEMEINGSSDRSEAWNFLYRVKKMISELCVADFKY
jgi:hypothetical protein